MNIAVCDDEVRGRERILTLLEKEFSQAQTCEFDSGMKLIESVKEGYRPDIVLLDIAMEGMDGMETARRLKELADAGVDLDLCGHTHDGQMFPGNLTVRMMWENACGYKKKGNMHNIVTSGVGIFGPNMRIGTIAEICSIDVVFEK